VLFRSIDKEYYPYLYFFDDESIDGMAIKLKETLNINRVSLHDFGRKAQEFVLSNKNSMIQAKKIFNMIIENN